jgi:hypothetical protein
MRPFMLYHWSPVSRRKGILRDGLCPRKISVSGDWRPPHVCFCRFPTVAWALSATHSGKKGGWDLWCVWSDVVAPYETCSGANNPKVSWWLTEYRCHHRIPKSKIWHVGVKTFTPRKKRK